MGDEVTRSAAASPVRFFADGVLHPGHPDRGCVLGTMGYIFLTASAGRPSFSVVVSRTNLGTGLRGSYTLIPTPVLTQNYLMYRRSRTRRQRRPRRRRRRTQADHPLAPRALTAQRHSRRAPVRADDVARPTCTRRCQQRR